MKKVLLTSVLLLSACLIAVPQMFATDIDHPSILWSESSSYKYNLKITSHFKKEKDNSRINDFLKELKRVKEQIPGVFSSRDVYVYTYTFENLGETKLKINFSEWKFIHSPFTDILQDYSFILLANETKVVKFLSNGQPGVVSSAINLGWWGKFFDEKKEKWNFVGAGNSPFYVPSWNAVYLEIE